MALQVLYHFDIVEFYSDHLAIVEFFYCQAHICNRSTIRSLCTVVRGCATHLQHPPSNTCLQGCFQGPKEAIC